jgi:hypothetical protein
MSVLALFIFAVRINQSQHVRMHGPPPLHSISGDASRGSRALTRAIACFPQILPAAEQLALRRHRPGGIQVRFPMSKALLFS